MPSPFRPVAALRQESVDRPQDGAASRHHASLKPPKDGLRVHPQRVPQGLIAEDLSALDVPEFGDPVLYHIRGYYQVLYRESRELWRKKMERMEKMEALE